MNEVANITAPANLERNALTGVGLVPSGQCQYGDVIKVGDVLRVNFDHQRVTVDGLHLVECMGADDVDWMGCRRFSRGIDGSLSVDDSGRGDWRRVDDLSRLRIVGRVEQVYRAV